MVCQKLVNREFVADIIWDPMKAIIPVFKVNIFESNAVSFLKIGRLDSHERHTFVIAFLHHTKSEICVFQIDWLQKVEKKLLVTLSQILDRQRIAYLFSTT
jgi:hypothetical protein